jgi:hypothetical protein
MNTYELEELLASERKNARREEAAACAVLLDRTANEVRLMAGDVTDQEVRSIMAVLGDLRNMIRSRHA